MPEAVKSDTIDLGFLTLAMIRQTAEYFGLGVDEVFDDERWEVRIPYDLDEDAFYEHLCAVRDGLAPPQAAEPLAA